MANACGNVQRQIKPVSSSTDEASRLYTIIYISLIYFPVRARIAYALELGGRSALCSQFCAANV